MAAWLASSRSLFSPSPDLFFFLLSLSIFLPTKEKQYQIARFPNIFFTVLGDFFRALLQSVLRRMKEEATDALAARDDFEPSLQRALQEFENRVAPDPKSKAVVVAARAQTGMNGHPNGLIEAQQPQCASAEKGGSTRDPEDLGEGHGFCMISGCGGAGDERGSSRFVDGGVIEMQDMEAALEGFSAESLHGAGLFRSGVEWGDVGGLRRVRAELREILEVKRNRSDVTPIPCLILFLF